MTSPVNNRPYVAPASTARTASTTQAPSTSELKDQGALTAKELLSGGSYNIGANKNSTKEQVAESLVKLLGDKGAQYAHTLESLGKDFKGRALEGVQKDMAAWLKDHPNANQSQIYEQANKTAYKHTMVNQMFKQTIEQMASAAISRMKDTFEG
ncbi:hypothetical protein [Archangium lansingense]|uniref:Uncharacterized protein n=1 Tax=Archangium lansingense TaxID=2995310 RepID=A0ABT4A3J5_9BACT|nr:hypothetical protein [Archangium lansinium]MCY1076215.1 hypothetical protein [Archangium lansinium]